jgi:hypothetical protein
MVKIKIIRLRYDEKSKVSLKIITFKIGSNKFIAKTKEYCW